MCTALRLTTTAGGVVHARTMDFADESASDVIVVPRGYALMSMAPGGEPGMTWTSAYAAIGVNLHGLPLLIDGVNEKGLAVSALYHPDYATYQRVDARDTSHTLAPLDVPVWLLTRCASVDAARARGRQCLSAVGLRRAPALRGARRRSPMRRRRIPRSRARDPRQSARRRHERARLRLARQESSELQQPRRRAGGCDVVVAV